MLDFFSNVAGLILGVFQWFTGYNERQIGKAQQQNVDLAANNQTLKAELDAAVGPVNSADELHKHDY